MQAASELILDDYYKLRISSKKLSSGRYQVKFYATVKENRQLYGYVLVESKETLREVVQRIRKRLNELEKTIDYKHIHLFNIGQKPQPTNFMIFE